MAIPVMEFQTLGYKINFTSYATIDVNNKIGLFTEKQRQISLINVIENRYPPTFNEIKLGPFNTLVITYDDPLIQRL